MSILSWLFGKGEEPPRPTTSDGVVVVESGGTLGGGEPRPFKLPAKSRGKHETAADELDWLCAERNATYEIVRYPDEIVVRLIMDNGNAVVSGHGKTGMDAVDNLLRKLGV